MSYLYFILGIIGWTITPIVILAYAFWPRDSKEKSIP
jgi:Mn2+/Fe2+ NRAMP family transporter